MNRKIKPILIGNAYGIDTHGGYGSDVFHQNGICRCLNAASGGAAETLVMIQEPTTCAIRGRNPENPSDRTAGIPTEQRLEVGGEVANCLTSVQKDSLIVEPQVKSIGNRNPSGHGIGGEVYDCEGLAPTLCVNKGSGYTIAEPRTIGYSRDKKGHIMNHHLKDESNTLHHGGGNTGQYVYEPQRTIAYKEMLNGDIRAYQANSPSKAGVPEQMITNPKNEPPTITTAQTPKIMEQKPKYRIRKLTPVETGRLMGMDDADIHKMLDPKDDKGKPVISKSQAYKLHGNSIVVDVLYHIFRRMFVETEPTEPIQLKLFDK